MKDLEDLFRYSPDEPQDICLAEDESIDYALAYDKAKAGYLKYISKYKKAKNYSGPELSKYKELIKKYSDEKTHKNDFFGVLDDFKKEIDALKTNAQKAKEQNVRFSEVLKKILYVILYPFILIVSAFIDDWKGKPSVLGVIFLLLPMAVAVTGWFIVIINHQQITTFMPIFWAYVGLVIYTVIAFLFTSGGIYSHLDHEPGWMTGLFISGSAFALLLGLTAGNNLKPDFNIMDKVSVSVYDKKDNNVTFFIENHTPRDIVSITEEMELYSGSSMIDFFKPHTHSFDTPIKSNEYRYLSLNFTYDGYPHPGVIACSFSDLKVRFKIKSVNYGIIDYEYTSDFVWLKRI